MMQHLIFFFPFFSPIHWKIKQIKVEMKGLKIATSTQNYDYADCNLCYGWPRPFALLIIISMFIPYYTFCLSILIFLK